jgi:hypothetical protein
VEIRCPYDNHRYSQPWLNRTYNQPRRHNYSHQQNSQFYFNQADQPYNSLQDAEAADAEFTPSRSEEFETVLAADLQTGWEQVCETLGGIYRRPDLRHKLAGAKLGCIFEKCVKVRGGLK